MTTTGMSCLTKNGGSRLLRNVGSFLPHYTAPDRWRPWSGRTITAGRQRLKCDGTCAETRFRLSAQHTSPFKSAVGRQFSLLLTSRGARISGSNAGYTMLRGSVKSTGYPLHSPVSYSLPLPWVTVCHHISAGLYSSFIAVTMHNLVIHAHYSMSVCTTFGQ